MAIVETKKIGNTTIHIDDCYCKEQTQEEITAILRRCGEIMMRDLPVTLMEQCLEEEMKDGKGE